MTIERQDKERRSGLHVCVSARSLLEVVFVRVWRLAGIDSRERLLASMQASGGTNRVLAEPFLHVSHVTTVAAALAPHVHTEHSQLTATESNTQRETECKVRARTSRAQPASRLYLLCALFPLLTKSHN